MDTGFENSKLRLRRKLSAVRSRLPLPELSQALRNVLLAWPDFRVAKRILGYAAFRGEIDLMPLALVCPEKEWYLPVVTPPEGNSETPGHLAFYRYHAGEILRPGRYGIPEPSTCEPLGAPEPDDLLLAPGLAFDQRGYRLGYGKGYYDRFLAESAAQGRAPRTIGVAPLALLRPALPVDPWDVRLDFLLTERGVCPSDSDSSFQSASENYSQ